jgi:flagellin-like hook-associated protein FlgL
VKTLIETSGITKNLLRVELADGAGQGIVTTRDDAVSLRGGTRLVGEAGGAWMLGNADEDPHSLVFESVNTGSREKVSLRVIEGNFQVTNAGGFITDTATGADAIVTLNGQKMSANGNQVSINNVMLSLDATLNSSVQAGDHISYSITGGGAIFQLGPNVVSNQQIRIAIPNVGSAYLGGANGKLYQLRSGENADLFTDTKLADRIVQDAISAIAVARGRLGAIQRSTLDPNQAVLEDTIEQLAAAEAVIFNADFAEESSRMTRNQILVQSGTQVLGIVNQFPQYAAQLLRG